MHIGELLNSKTMLSIIPITYITQPAETYFQVNYSNYAEARSLAHYLEHTWIAGYFQSVVTM